MTNMRVDFVS